MLYFNKILQIYKEIWYLVITALHQVLFHGDWVFYVYILFCNSFTGKSSNSWNIMGTKIYELTTGVHGNNCSMCGKRPMLYYQNYYWCTEITWNLLWARADQAVEMAALDKTLITNDNLMIFHLHIILKKFSNCFQDSLSPWVNIHSTIIMHEINESEFNWQLKNLS